MIMADHSHQHLGNCVLEYCYSKTPGRVINFWQPGNLLSIFSDDDHLKRLPSTPINLFATDNFPLLRDVVTPGRVNLHGLLCR